jgi:hypothetical protein
VGAKTRWRTHKSNTTHARAQKRTHAKAHTQTHTRTHTHARKQTRTLTNIRETPTHSITSLCLRVHLPLSGPACAAWRRLIGAQVTLLDSSRNALQQLTLDYSVDTPRLIEIFSFIAPQAGSCGDSGDTYLPAGSSSDSCVACPLGFSCASGAPVPIAVISSIDGGTDMPTAGGTTVTLHGLNLGAIGDTVSATYSFAGDVDVYTAVNCTVTTAGTTIMCTTAPGVGAGLVWTVTTTAGSVSDASTAVVSYAPPSVTAVTTGSMATAGGDAFVLVGSNFGPVAQTVSATYGPYTTSCLVTIADTVITCTTVPGVGGGHNIVVSVGGQDSAETGPISYAAPAVSAISGALTSSGGDEILLYGTNFGPAASGGTISVTYAPTDGTTYTASSCTIVTDNTLIHCYSAPGSGCCLAWTVTVADVTGSPSTATLSYNAPVITGISVTGALSTAGGETVTITGTGFGMDNSVVPTATYGPTGVEYVATGCMLSSGIAMCTTAPGVGANQGWEITLAGVTSGLSTAQTSYAPPSISSLAGGTALSTLGGTSVTLTGTNFGDGTSSVTAQYGSSGSSYTASECVVATAHTAVRCTTVAGVGTSLPLSLIVGGQSSATAAFQPVVSYAAPSLTGASLLSGAQSLRTVGGDAFVLSGTSFGPIGATASVTYGPYTGTEYTGVACSVASGGVSLGCTSASGLVSSAGLKFIVVVGRQTSSTLSTSLNYYLVCTAAPGRYCPVGTNDAGGVACLGGSTCAGGAAAPVACGTRGTWCPAGSSAPSNCSIGHYGTAGGASGYTDNTCGGACSCNAGAYCPVASFSGAGVACPATFYCGGASAPAVACSAGSFCPAASGAPTPCTAGHYGTTSGMAGYTSSACAGPCTAAAGSACAPGSSDPGGRLCAAGFYCSGGAAVAIGCASAGYYCPVGSVSQAMFQCAAVSRAVPPRCGVFALGWMNARRQG